MPETAFSSTGKFETAFASKYLQQLCKHFAHKVDVSYDETSGRAAFSSGPATLSADDTQLIVTVTADNDDGIALARHIIDSHLMRFAHRENFIAMEWT